jgi:hypothetical protein
MRRGRIRFGLAADFAGPCVGRSRNTAVSVRNALRERASDRRHGRHAAPHCLATSSLSPLSAAFLQRARERAGTRCLLARLQRRAGLQCCAADCRWCAFALAAGQHAGIKSEASPAVLPGPSQEISDSWSKRMSFTSHPTIAVWTMSMRSPGLAERRFWSRSATQRPRPCLDRNSIPRSWVRPEVSWRGRNRAPPELSSGSLKEA